ncbi:hypothetical protein SDC9_91567 [bioreactor metagenome]|uniref:Uncharacterized protein n=1 Tax=bioreactor metagenome TaxID=1076179 RepID=A0A644ZVD1_9ZZZZ
MEIGKAHQRDGNALGRMPASNQLLHHFRVERQGFRLHGALQILQSPFAVGLLNIGNSGQRNCINARTGAGGQPLQLQHLRPSATEGDRCSGPTGPAGAADAVNIGIGLFWNIEIYHVVKVTDVDTACRHIGGN